MCDKQIRIFIHKLIFKYTNISIIHIQIFKFKYAHIYEYDEMRNFVSHLNNCKKKKISIYFHTLYVL